MGRLSNAQKQAGIMSKKGVLFTKSSNRLEEVYRVVRNCDTNQPTLYGSEMECPVEISFRDIPHLDNHHGDGHMVYEYTSEPIDLKALAEFTLECEKRVLNEDGQLHSYYERGGRRDDCGDCYFDYCDHCEHIWDNHMPDLTDEEQKDYNNGELDTCAYCPVSNGNIGSCDICNEVGYTEESDDYLDMGDSCSNHIHVTPRHYNMYDNLYWLTRLYAPLFSSSPSIREEGTYLSERRRTTNWARASHIDELDFYTSIDSRQYNALTPNEMGTIEFRYNDFSKTPATPLFFGALFELSRLYPRKTNKIDRTIGSTSTVRRYERRVPKMKDFARKVTADILKDQQFYSWYSNKMVHFDVLVNDMIEVELQAYQEFDGDIDDWTNNFAPYVVGKSVPNVLSTVANGQFVEV